MKLEDVMIPDRAELGQRAVKEWNCTTPDMKKYVSYLLSTGKKFGNPNNSSVLYVIGVTDIRPTGDVTQTKGGGCPDIDLDFCTERRSEIVKYIEAKYGSERVANIITFNKMKARAAIKDASRAVQISNYVVESDKIAKMIPLMSEDIKETIEGSEELKQYAIKYPEMFAAANALLGKPKSVSIHAAGVVITPDSLVDYFPLYYSAKEKHAKNYASITQWDMYDMDECGFLKVDILGLNTLTIIDRTIKSVNARHGTSLEIERIDLEDPRVLDLFARGNTTGLFQLERRYVQQFCRSMGIRAFRDVVDMNAIIRPGTMNAGMTKEFIDRKNGRKDIEYIHPELEPVLKDTQGILVYQETAMKIAQVYAGFSLAEADNLRKAIGKKMPEKMAQAKNLFMKLAVENKNRDVGEAEKIFSYIEAFGRYGFNKSHAVSYAKITFQAGYLKAYYPTEYMCELLNGEVSASPGAAKIEMYTDEARFIGIRVNRPSVMDGDVAFRIREDGSIDFGLGFIRHVGAQAAKEALKMKGCFTNLTMFLAKTSTRILNERAIKSMIAGGAFDFTGLTRNILFEKHQAVGELVHKYKDQQKRKKEGVKLKTELTLEEIAVIESGVTVRQHPFTMEQLLDMEHEVLGAFISQSPTAPFEHIIREKTNTDIFDIMEGNMLGKDLCFAARINDIRTHIVKNGDNAGKEMAFVNVSYHSCDVDAMVFTATYAKLKQVLKIGKIYIFRGESERRAFLSITDAELLSQT